MWEALSLKQSLGNALGVAGVSYLKINSYGLIALAGPQVAVM